MSEAIVLFKVHAQLIKQISLLLLLKTHNIVDLVMSGPVFQLCFQSRSGVVLQVTFPSDMKLVTIWAAGTIGAHRIYVVALVILMVGVTLMLRLDRSCLIIVSAVNVIITVEAGALGYNAFQIRIFFTITNQ